MCDPVSLAVGSAVLGGGGIAAKFIGQKQGAKAVDRVVNEEDAKQRGFQQKALNRAAQTVNAQNPGTLVQDAATPDVAPIGPSNADLASAFATTQGAGRPEQFRGQLTQGATTSAQAADKQDYHNQMLRAFGLAMDQRGRGVRDLQQDQSVIARDAATSAAGLGQRVDQAGRKGSTLRLIGGSAQGLAPSLAGLAGGL
jgi:hypothetical protein